MNTEEKFMLLHCLMMDMHIDPIKATRRMKYAIAVAQELGCYAIPRRLTALLDFTHADLFSGKALRVSHVYGGYEGLGDMYSYPPRIMIRSKEFQKKALQYLRNADKLFVDVI